MRQEHLLNSAPPKGRGLKAAKSRKNSILVPNVVSFRGLSPPIFDISPDICSDHYHQVRGESQLVRGLITLRHEPRLSSLPGVSVCSDRGTWARTQIHIVVTPS